VNPFANIEVMTLEEYFGNEEDVFYFKGEDDDE